MLFQKSINRAMEWLRSRRGEEPQGEDKVSLEKGDVFAMVVSAMIVILPIALIVLVVISLIAMLGFLR